MALKILNLYAGIGGNRKLWTGDIEVTAIELNPVIAGIYSKFFPNDKVIVADAHEYLLNHFEEFDFIWSSPPCPSHSRIRFELGVLNGKTEVKYPDMQLYQEIILLTTHFNGKWCVENVRSYYEPLIKPQDVGDHYFWANFIIGQKTCEGRLHHGIIKELETRKGFDLAEVECMDKRMLLRNCVEPEVGLHIFNSAFKEKQKLLVSVNGSKNA